MAIDGISVLNVIEHTVRGWGLTPLSFLFILVCLLSIMAMLYASNHYYDEESASIFFTGFICLILFATCAAASGTNKGPIKEHYYTYKVTIDDSVNFNEFNQHYQVISQEGLIYEIREIESDID